MGELSDRARSRVTTGRAEHELALRELAQRQADAAEQTAHWTQRWAERMGQHNNVLETGNATIDSSGVWGRDFRAPFATVAVLNRSAVEVLAASGGRSVAPGDGAGHFTVPGSGFVRMPLVGTSLTVYGTPGAELTYSVLAGPAPPLAGGLGVNGPEPRPSAAALTNVPASVASVVLAAANATRRGLVVVNDSASATLFMAFAATASATGYTLNLLPGDRYEMAWPHYTGDVSGIWSAAVGTARVTELG